MKTETMPNVPVGSRLASSLVCCVTAAVVVASCRSREAQPASDSTVATPASPQLMTPQAFQAITHRPPDQVIAYGKDSSQYGELRVPTGAGPHPVAVLVHGGCFKAQYAKASEFGPVADALKDDGIATWNIEYRRLGQPGSGWPGTYLDVSNAVDHLRALAREHRLDLNRVVLVGHSAGGHLALWAAARHRLPRGSEIRSDNPLHVRGVIDLAGPVDMSANISGYESLCRDSVITTMLGGSPSSVPDRYTHASPMKLVPVGLPQVIVLGTHEDFVPRAVADQYVTTARSAGDSVRLIVVPDVGHFEIATTQPPSWPLVHAAIRSLLDGKLPPVASDSARSAR